MSCVYRASGLSLASTNPITYPGGGSIEVVDQHTIRFTFTERRTIDEVDLQTTNAMVFTFTAYDEDREQLGSSKVSVVFVKGVTAKVTRSNSILL